GVLAPELSEDEGEELPPLQPRFVTVDDGDRQLAEAAAMDGDTGPGDRGGAVFVADDLGLGEAEFVGPVGVEDLTVVQLPDLDEVFDQRTGRLGGVSILTSKAMNTSAPDPDGRKLMVPDYAGPMTNPAAVLWDMDGTLVDTEPYWIRAETELMNAHGLSWSEEQGLEFVGNELLTSATMVQQAGLDLSATEIVETLMGKVIDHIRTSVPFRPGALELLAELRAEAVPCVMVTMSYRRLAEAVIASCPVE